MRGRGLIQRLLASRRRDRWQEPVFWNEAIAAARAVVASDKLVGKVSDPTVVAISERQPEPRR